MKFYTNVSRYGNGLLYRGYEYGKKVERRIKYKPTYFVSSAKGDWTSLMDGQKVAPISFDSMSEAKKWQQANKHVAGRNIFGNNRHIYAFIQDEFPGDIEWNFEKFLINRDGEVIKRYPPATTPDDAVLLQDISDVL